MTRTARSTVAVALIAAALALPARADQTSSALISAQLDKPVKLELKNTPLPQVLQKIETETGVPVRVSEDVYATLPWGEQTPINAAVEGVPLRDALTAISAKLGLRFDLRDEFVELTPVPSLRRMGRRATLQELRTLDLLNGAKLSARADGWTIATLTAAIDAGLQAIDQRLAAQKQPPAHLVLEVRSTQAVDLAKSPVLVPRDATLAGALDAIAQQSKLTWYPWGDGVVVLPKRDVIAARLERPVSMRYDGVDIAQVYLDLARQSGVSISVEPGAIQRVTPEFRIIRMSVESASVRQALDSLQGYTGLGYVVTDDGVYIWNQSSNPASGSRGRATATIEVAPGTHALVYEDLLSPEARRALTERRDKAIAELEERLTGVKPPTPTSQPNN